MSVGRLKNLNLLIEFSNSIFIKSLLCFFYFKLFICYPDVKRLRFFRGFTPWTATSPHTAQKMKLSIKDFSSKCDQIRRKLRIWSHLLEKSLKENFIFLCTVSDEPIAELATPRDPHLHFTTFENSIVVQKRTLVNLLE